MSTDTGEILLCEVLPSFVAASSPHRASPGTGDALSGDTPNVAGVGDVPANSKGESSRDAAPDASFLSKEPLAPASGNKEARERADRARAGGVSSFAADGEPSFRAIRDRAHGAGGGTRGTPSRGSFVLTRGLAGRGGARAYAQHSPRERTARERSRESSARAPCAGRSGSGSVEADGSRPRVAAGRRNARRWRNALANFAYN